MDETTQPRTEAVSLSVIPSAPQAPESRARPSDSSPSCSKGSREVVNVCARPGYSRALGELTRTLSVRSCSVAVHLSSRGVTESHEPARPRGLFGSCGHTVS